MKSDFFTIFPAKKKKKNHSGSKDKYSVNIESIEYGFAVFPFSTGINGEGDKI